MNAIIKQLNWRYATKQYDKTKKVSPEDIAVLKESIRLAPSAFGLQPFHYSRFPELHRLAGISSAEM